MRNELQPQVTMLNARFKRFELQVLWPLALVQSCRGREISHGEKDGDTGMVSTEGEKGSPQERELVGPGTEMSSTASKRQHAGGGEVMELTQDATVQPFFKLYLNYLICQDSWIRTRCMGS